MHDRILVPADGSACADRGLEEACHLATAHTRAAARGVGGASVAERVRKRAATSDAGLLVAGTHGRYGAEPAAGIETH